jgi:hypothetical protein
MQWHFGWPDFDLPSHPYAPLRRDINIPRLNDCEAKCGENYASDNYQEGTALDWQPRHEYCCCREADDVNTCVRGKRFYRPRLTNVITTVFFHRGKAYQGCDDANAEVCGYLVVAKMSFGYQWDILTWFDDGGSESGECATLIPFPDVEDIPTDAALTAGSGVINDATGVWTLESNSGTYWSYPNGSGSVVRVRFVQRLNDDAVLLEKNEEVALVFSAVKHQPECCDLWDCVVELDCSDPAEFILSTDADEVPTVSGPPYGVLVQGIPDVFTINEFQSWEMSWDLAGGTWGIWNVP